MAKQAYRTKPEYVETRSKRINLLLRPSLYKTAAALAEKKEISFYHLMELALIQYLNRQ